MKRQLEFFAADAMAWRAAQQPGTEEEVLSRDADDPAVLTRLVRSRLPAAPCSKSGTASPHDELVGSAPCVTGLDAARTGG